MANRYLDFFNLVFLMAMVACQNNDIQSLSLAVDSRFPAGPSLWITLNEEKSGKLVKVSSEGVQSRTMHWDSVVRVFPRSRQVFVINRWEADNITEIDGESLAVKGQVSVGAGSNPQDLVFWNATWWVSLLHRNQIGRTTSPSKEYQMIALPPKLDPTDDVAELSDLTVLDNRLLGVVQKLDAHRQWLTSELHGAIVEFNEKGEITHEAPTLFKNPVTELKSWNGRILLGQAGAFMGDSPWDGGVEWFDSTLRSLGAVVTEAQLGGNIVDIEILPQDRLLVLTSGVGSDLWWVDLTSGKVVRRVLSSPGYRWTKLLRDDSRKLVYVLDQDRKSPALRLLDIESLEALSYTIELPLRPYDIALGL